MKTSIRLATVKPRYWLEEQLYHRSGDGVMIEALRGRRSGTPMLVVGNGPSLNETPLESFEAIPAIGTNKIDLIYRRTTWRPEMVISVNSSVIRQNVIPMLSAGVPLWFPRKARYFVPASIRAQINWFHLRPSAAFSTDLPRGAGFGATVTYTALQFAYWLGADPVILVGVDHSFAVAGKTPNQYERLEGDDPNHFDPTYFADQRWAVPDLATSEDNYRAARRAFEADGRRVLDATIGGKLTVFEKLDIDAAVQLASG